MPNMAAWVDTGFLVALFARNDPHHTSAVEFLANHQRLSLHSLWPVVTETGFSPRYIRRNRAPELAGMPRHHPA